MVPNESSGSTWPRVSASYWSVSATSGTVTAKACSCPHWTRPSTRYTCSTCPCSSYWGGLTFSRRGGFKAFLARKAKTLLVPYYVFSLYFLAKPFAILLIPSMRATFQTSHDYGIAHQFLDVLVMGNGLWFLMAFFVGECLMYGLTSLTDDGRCLPLLEWRPSSCRHSSRPRPDGLHYPSRLWPESRQLAICASDTC